MSVRSISLLLFAVFASATLHAARERPGGDDAVVLFVEAVLREGDLERAVLVLDGAIRKQPKALYYAMRGGLRGEQRDLAGAIEDLSQAVRLDPKLAVAWRDRGLARMLLGQYELALGDLDAAVRLDEEEPKGWAARASLQLQRGAWREAIADADAALRLDPRMVPALHDRAAAKMQHGALREALADFEALLEIQPRQAIALTSRAQVHRRLGDLDSAQADADRAVLADAHFAGAYVERATIRGARGDFPGAIQDCTTALLIDGDHRDALMVRALLHIQSGAFAGAREDLEAALRQAGADPAVVRHNLAWLLAACPDAEVRDATRATALAREALEQFGDRSPHVFDALAAAAAEMGDFAVAIEYAERSVQATDARTPSELAARRERLELYRNQGVYRLPRAPRAAEAAAPTHAEALLRAGDHAGARRLLEEAVWHQVAIPARTLSTLAWLLATAPDEAVRDGPRAVALAQQALAAGAGGGAFDALAAGCAETGDFPAAIEAAQRALDATDSEESEEFARRRERLEHYRNAEVWRLPAAPARAAAPGVRLR